MMKNISFFLFLLLIMKPSVSQILSFDHYPVYEGDDLGLHYTPAHADFKIWSPTARAARIIFYESGTGGKPLTAISMQSGDKGVWQIRVEGDKKGLFYVFQVNIDGQWSDELVDPYAKAVGLNGARAQVLDLRETNPAGWDRDRGPALAHPTDAIIYELQIRDASIDKSSGIRHGGKYLGLAEMKTRNAAGQKTGLSHIRELGVTHVHLLPFFDFNSIDESKPGIPAYNWGYDPLHYNAPEGSFSTNAADGEVRIRELKSTIRQFHQQGLGVIMDVVYNHTSLTKNSLFNQLVPGYYYRQDKEGNFSNATACGNEIASERPMVRKFILESVLFWAREYHVDGFRFDLMGVMDIETMNVISAALHQVNPDILLYGEGWTAGFSPLPDSLRALKANVSKLKGIAVFSDDIRDGIKGHVFTYDDRGFASGKPGMEETIKFGVAASCPHPQIDYGDINYSKAPYADQPSQIITYCECHDNHALYDKLKISAKDAGEDERKAMQALSLSIVLTSQGISFLHAGTEFLRNKKEVENSFESPDGVNAIDWNLKSVNRDFFSYVKGLIKMRRKHPAFRLTTGEQVRDLIRFREDLPPGMVGFTIDGKKAGDNWSTILVVYNGSQTSRSIDLPEGKWTCEIFNSVFIKGKRSGFIQVAPYSCSVFYRKN